MKRPLLCFLLVFALKPLSAQTINLDSLVKVAILVSTKDKAGPPENPDSILRTLFDSKSPAERIRKVYDIILLDNGELDQAKAFYYHRKILDLAKKNNDAIVEAVITGELGYTLYQDGDSPAGLKMMFDALALAEKTGNEQAIGTVYDNLGVCNENDDAEISYAKKAFQHSMAGGDNLFAIAELENLSDAYFEKKDHNLAKYYLSKALELAIHGKVYYLINNCVTEVGDIQPDNKSKLKYYRDALLIFSHLPQFYARKRGSILLSIAKVYQDEHKRDSALIYTKKAYSMLSGKLLAKTLPAAQLLAQLYTGKNADSALKYTQIYYITKDSLYSLNKMERAQSMTFAEQQRRQELAAQKTAFETTTRLYLTAAAALLLLVLAVVFWRNNRLSKKANLTLQTQKTQVQNTLLELKQTQGQLIQAEKMVSLGELTAGIAHEIQNPLNFVNNFSEVNKELLGELKAESRKPKAERNHQLEDELIDDLIDNSEKINHHGKRADFIVKGMLEHSRTSTSEKQLTNLNTLADEFLKLSYHGLRAKDKNFNAGLIFHFDENLPKTNVVQQDIGRVLLNLFNNAFYAVNEKKKTAGDGYKPEVTLITSLEAENVCIKVKDNGNGIPDAIKEKIMQPFFTTKPTGEGTGLGLSLSYDIVVKGHGGKIDFTSKEGAGTEFTIALPPT